jgi:hypothetical protein
MVNMEIGSRSERAASGFGKKVVGCNGEVRDGASGVGVRVAASYLTHSLISSVE